MFKRLRETLEEFAGKRTRFPPPALSDPATAPALLHAIETFLREDPERFRRLFLFQRPLRVGRGDLPLFETLAAVGLVVKRSASIYAPCVRLFPFLGRLVATDLLTHRDPDQVFSLMFEQVYLVRNMDVRPDDRVLELCLGSGVNGLFASDRAMHVTGTEISARALGFARFNETLCPGAVPLDLREGSLFEPVESDRRFDLMLVNPPFELVPPGESWFLHSHGGEDGLDVVRALLAKAPGRMDPKGRLELISWSPGTASSARLAGLVRESFPAHRVTVHELDVQPIDGHLAPFKRSKGYAEWRRRLADEGLTHVHFLFLRSEPSAAPGLDVIRPDAEIDACHAISDEWLL